jgi:hypothetical protein
MIKVTKKINLEQLDKEINANGLNADLNQKGEIVSVGLAENSTLTEQDLIDGIANHTAVFVQPTVAEKLASVGLSIDDLKAALGV